jgi:hypothetical protein
MHCAIPSGAVHQPELYRTAPLTAGSNWFNTDPLPTLNGDNKPANK